MARMKCEQPVRTSKGRTDMASDMEVSNGKAMRRRQETTWKACAKLRADEQQEHEPSIEHRTASHFDCAPATCFVVSNHGRYSIANLLLTHYDHKAFVPSMPPRFALHCLAMPRLAVSQVASRKWLLNLDLLLLCAQHLSRVSPRLVFPRA